MYVLRRAAALLVIAFAVLAVVAVAANAEHGKGDRHAAHSDSAKGGSGEKAQSDQLPVDAIQTALQAKGSLIDGVMNVELDRTDIGTVMLDSPAGSVPAKPAWEINGTVTFQPLGNGQAFLNGDLALKPGELDPFIHALLANHLVFQAEHQHMYDFNPIVWFVHFRGTGDPVTLATEVHNALEATSTPLPQEPPSNPTTPLDPGKLKSILHGFNASVGSDGVVTVLVARKNPITIDGVHASQAANIATNIAFEPLNASGSDTAVMPDFGMTAEEINPVVSTMQAMGWDIGCLYNQETAEQPQLFFSHEFKHGDPYQLAREIRQALDHMNVH